MFYRHDQIFIKMFFHHFFAILLFFNNCFDEIKNELIKIKRYKSKLIRDNLFYESSKQIYDFRVFKTIRYFGDSIYNH